MTAADELVDRTWTLAAIGDDPADPSVTTALQFGADGRLTGTGGVNRVVGSFELTAGEITFSGGATTRMAGPPAAMAQEHAVLAVLNGTQPWTLDGSTLTIGAARFTDTSSGDTVTVSGNVLYRERIALPPGAVVIVEVRDVSRADAPSVRLAEQRIEPEHQVPIPFSIEVPAAALEGVVTAGVAARIEVDGELAWISDTHHPVATDGPTTVDIRVVSAGSR